MSDDLVPVPDVVRALPAPRVVSEALKAELYARVAAERNRRGDVHQPEDVSPLVRALAGAKELLEEYARAFTRAATIAKDELDTELFEAVGQQAGIPNSGLTVPDLDGTDILFSLLKPNKHDIDTDQVITVVINNLIEITRDTEPEWDEDVEEAPTYRARYEAWMAGVMRLAVEHVIELGTYAMQVSKVRAFATDLAGTGCDAEAAVVRGSITTTARYGGIKVDRKERKKR